MTVQLALSIAISYTAFLLDTTLVRLRAVTIGVDAERVVLARFNLAGSGLSERQSLALYPKLVAQARSLPGVEAAAFSSSSLLSGSQRTQTVYVEGDADGQEPVRQAVVETITDEYFRTLGMPLLAGRGFGSVDATDTPRAAIVNQVGGEPGSVGPAWLDRASRNVRR